MIAYGQETTTRELEANDTDDQREVARRFYAQWKFWPDSIEHEDGTALLVGTCESCGEPLFEGEALRQWEDGIVTHEGSCKRGGT